MKSLLIFLISITFCLNIKSQEFYTWCDWYGFGIADLSNCDIIRLFDKPAANPGATINVFKCPDGLFYRATETDGGFLNTSEPYFYTPIKKHLYIGMNRHLERAVSASINSKSLIYIVMRAWNNSISYLMEYDYNTGRFTILGNVSKGVRSIVALGNKLIGIEEILQPYRYYNIVDLNLQDLSKPKVLFQIDSSYWVKDYNPMVTSPYMGLFKNYQTCDHADLVLSSYTNHDSITKFYKLDFKNKKIVPACDMDIKVYFAFFFGEGIKGFDYLRDCRFDIDFDLNNSSDTANNYRTVYECPQEEQKIHDKDWVYYSDGPLDSLRVELLSGNLDTPNEYLKANYIPQGLNLIGDKTQSLLFTSQNKISTAEIEKILDGIVYINELKEPSPGERLIRTCIYIPWYDDTAYTRISIPVFEKLQSNTSIWLCPDGVAYPIDKFIPSLASLNGHWLNSDLKSGFINAGITKKGTYPYLYTRGMQCIPDTILFTLNYYPNPEINLGPDVLAQGNSNQTITLTGDLNILNSINWFLNGNLVSNKNNSFTFNFIQDSLIKVTVITNDQCFFSDSVQYILKISDDDIWMPNAFSPNGDHINDWFGITAKYNLLIYNFEIFDRWGNKFFNARNFHIQDESQSWNGTANGFNSSPGPYIYLIEYAGTSGRRMTKTGIIHLIR